MHAQLRRGHGSARDWWWLTSLEEPGMHQSYSCPNCGEYRLVCDGMWVWRSRPRPPRELARKEVAFAPRADRERERLVHCDHCGTEFYEDIEQRGGFHLCKEGVPGSLSLVQTGLRDILDLCMEPLTSPDACAILGETTPRAMDAFAAGKLKCNHPLGLRPAVDRGCSAKSCGHCGGARFGLAASGMAVFPGGPQDER